MAEILSTGLPEKQVFTPGVLVQIVMDPEVFKAILDVNLEGSLDVMPPIPQPWEWTADDDLLDQLEKDLSDLRNYHGQEISNYFYDPYGTKTSINKLGLVKRSLVNLSLYRRDVTREKAFEMLLMLDRPRKLLNEKYVESTNENVRSLHDSVKHIPYSLALLFLPDLTDEESQILFKMTREEVVERADPTL